MPSLGLALRGALAGLAALRAAGAPGRGPAPGNLRSRPLPGGKPERWDAGITRNSSKVCKVMVPLWQAARKLLGGLNSIIADEECSHLHEYYMGPHFDPELEAYGYKVPVDCLGYVGIFKSGSSETLCNLRNKFGKRARWARGMRINMMQRHIQVHMFPVVNESEGAVDDPQAKYYEDNPQDLARADREGRPRHGTGFTWVRDPALRFVSGYSEIEYYFTVGEPYFFSEIVLHGANRRKYVPGTMVKQAKEACRGCSFYDMLVNSTERAKRFVLDLLMLRMRPDFFLWRHIVPQVAQANGFFQSAGPLDFVCQLESFDRGWEFIGMLTNRTMDHFNRSCIGHNYSGSGAGFGPRDTMHRNVFDTEEVSSGTRAASGADPEARKDETDASISLIAKSLGCALLLPDYVCFGYKNIVEPKDCVAAGFASSLQQWENIEGYICEQMCPGVRRWIGGLYDSGPLSTSSVWELFNEKRAADM